MKNRIWLFLAALVLVFALGITVSAEELPQSRQEQQAAEVARIKEEARQIYHNSLYASGRESFQGHCGLMVSHQMYEMGINTVFISNDGNKLFDYYSQLEKTTGGYYINAYSVEEYNLEDALNHITQNGTRDVYNILVGFQWTNTEAGQLYGHACMINAILDGQVYFVESFYTSIGGAEGNLLVCSIEKFADYCNDGMTYEGIVHFGTLEEICENYDACAVLEARFDTTLRSQPALVGTKECIAVRPVQAGERLVSHGLVKDRNGEVFYRIIEDGQTRFVSANAVRYLNAHEEDLVLEGLEMPQQLELDADGRVAGQVVAKHGQVAAVSITISDADGNILLRERAQGGNLADVNQELDFSLLPAGQYRVEVAADAGSAIWQGDLKNIYTHTQLYNGTLTVGEADTPPPEQTETLLSGWFSRDSKWYCIQDGAVVTGWLEHRGVRYYLDDTGAAATGWREIDGKYLYFSQTGALVEDFVVIDGIRCQLDNDGTESEKQPTEE